MRLRIFGLGLLFALNLAAQPSSWSFIASNYQYSGSMISYLYIDGIHQTQERTILIKSGNEVRGIGTPLPSTNGLYFITFHSNEIEGDSLQLEVYLPEQAVIYPIYEKYLFKANMICGSIETPDILNVYTDGDIPPKIGSIPIQMTFKGQNFKELILNPYAIIADQDSFYWVASDGNFLLPSIRGDTLKVNSYGTPTQNSDTLLLGLIESTPNHHAAYVQLIYTYNVGNYDLKWDSIPGQSIQQGDTFPSFDLDNYWLSQFDPTCIDFNFQIQTDFPNGYDSKPDLSINETSFTYNMSVTSRVQFTEGLIFNHEDDVLVAYTEDQIVGISTPSLIGEEAYHFMNIYSHSPNSLVTFKFYSGQKTTLFTLSDTLMFQANGTLGAVGNPFILETTPIEIKINENNEVQTTILDPNWLGYLNVSFSLADCQFPNLITDTTNTYFSIGLVDVCNEEADFQRPVFLGHQNLSNHLPFRQTGSYRNIRYTAWEDSLTPTHPVIPDFQQWSCLRSTPFDTLPSGSDLKFDTFHLTSDEVREYLFILSRTNESEEPFLLALYQDTFYQNHPCRNLIGIHSQTTQANPLRGLGLTSGHPYAPWLKPDSDRIQFPYTLEKDQSYILLVGQYNDHPSPTTPFTTYWIHDKGDQNAFAYFKFYAEDISEVLLSEPVNLTSAQYLTGGNALEVANLIFEGNQNLFDSKWYLLGQKLLTPSDSSDLAWHNFVNQPENAPNVDLLQFHHGFKPLVLENCPNWSISLHDSYISAGDCQNLEEGIHASYIERTYIVQDNNALTVPDTAVVHMLFSNPLISDVYLPPSVQTISCGEIPDTTYPYLYTLNGIMELTSQHIFGSLGAGFEDKAFLNTCGLNQGFRREWTIYDFCRPGESLLFQQLIQSQDWTPPIFTEGAPYIHAQLEGNQCEGLIQVTRLNATDICGTVSTGIRVIHEASQIEVGSAPFLSDSENGFFDTLFLNGVSLGQYTVHFEAKDACGNSITRVDTVVLSDLVPPTCLLKDELRITLSRNDQNGVSGLPAENFDAGSRDNCGPVELKGRRNSTDPWSDIIWFTCEDADQKVPISILVLGNGDATECHTTAVILDQYQPECPERTYVEIPCSYELKANQGWEIFLDSAAQIILDQSAYLCQFEFDADLYTLPELSSCGIGYVTRALRIYNPDNPDFQSDTCLIHLIAQPSVAYEITFVKNSRVVCQEDLSLTSFNMEAGGCDLVVHSMRDESFQGTGAFCTKVIRTHRVINWCEFEGETQPWILDYSAPNLKVAIDYKKSLSYSEIQYSPSEEALDSSEKVVHLIDFKPSLQETDTLKSLTFQEYSEKGKGFFQYVSYLTWEDKVSPEIQLYFPSDDAIFYTQPSDSSTPSCEAKVQLTGALVGECPKEQLISVDFQFVGEVQTINLEAPGSAIILLDTLLAAGVYPYYVGATDECGNHWEQLDSFYVVDTLCTPPIEINGKITTVEQQGIEKVSVTLNGAVITQTDQKGNYWVPPEQTINGGYLNFSKNQDYLNGVSTLDMILLRNHILGIIPLEDTYSLLASDTDGSGDLSTRDMIEMRRVILTQADTFAIGKSWIFLPLQEDRGFIVNGVEEIPKRITGVKMGDVNRSALQDVEPRGNEQFFLYLEESATTDGLIKIKVFPHLIESAVLSGIQLGFSFGSLELEGIESGVISDIEMYLNEDHQLFISHLSDGEVHSEPLFSFIIKNPLTGKWRDEIKLLEGGYIASEAYNEFFEKSPVALLFERLAEGINVQQNYPNPFQGHSTIAIHADQRDCGIALISDWKGKEIHSESVCWQAGLTTYQIPQNLDWSSGWYYFTLKTPGQLLTIKMIKSD